MSLEPFQEKILKQIIHQEQLLSRLYAIFSKQFPQHKEFWENLSKEEEKHAKLITKLYEAAKTGSIFFSEGKTKSYTLEAFIKYQRGRNIPFLFRISTVLLKVAFLGMITSTSFSLSGTGIFSPSLESV